MGAKKQTIGYRYYLSLLSGLCRGPLDEFVEIKAADKTAWSGSITDNALSQINAPNLFGGEKKEGGLQGPFAVFMGADDQVLPGAQGKLPSVKAAIGTGRVSQFRGVVTVWYDGLVSAMNPYVKEWSFRVRRYRKGWWKNQVWYPEKALIVLENRQVTAMNGAHIIYECSTNPLWGRGLPANRINENSFIYAANKLCSENFGICLAWYRKEDIDVFMQKVCDLIGAVVYTDRETGLLTIKLVRDDYVVNDLPLFTPDSGLIEIREDDSASAEASVNEVIGTGRSPITNQDFQVRAQNLAAFQSQQSVGSLDQDYQGIPTKDLLARVVLRDLRANNVGLKKYNVVLDRRAWRLSPGMPFRISDPKRGLNNVVLRAGEIDDGNMLNGSIGVRAVQDVFGLPSTRLVTPVESSWTPPPSVALPPPEQRLIEASYRDVYLIVGSGDAETAAPDAAYIGQLAIAPNAASYQYDLATKADGEEYDVRVTGSFTGNAKLAESITATATSLVLAELQSFDASNVGQALYIQNELVRLDAFDEATSTATVTRGVGDTIPQPHPALARLWTIDDDLINDGRAYTSGETVYAKVLTRIANDALALDDATEETIDLIGRQGRPYPVADVKVGGVSVFDTLGENPEPIITWETRNRITQADQLVGYFEPSVAPEAGQQVTIRIYDPADDTTPLREVTGIDGTTWTYDATMQGEDNPPNIVRVEIESTRDGLVSWQKQSFEVALVSGWGYGWGYNWGGV